MSKSIHDIINPCMVPQKICCEGSACHMKTTAFYIFSLRQDTVESFCTYLTGKFSVWSF